jgi:Glu-tRNA(Gln) amidotransferase subunit E-like FAD-binding protein
MKKYDLTAAAALQAEGLERSLAVGISRLEIVEKWRQLVQTGVTPTRAADVWLNPLSEVAKEYQIHPKSLDLPAEKIRDALELVSTGELDSKSLTHLLARMLDESEDPASLAQKLGLTKSSNERTVRQAIDVVVREQKSRIAGAGSDRARESYGMNSLA